MEIKTLTNNLNYKGLRPTICYKCKINIINIIFQKTETKSNDVAKAMPNYHSSCQNIKTKPPSEEKFNTIKIDKMSEVEYQQPFIH